MKNYTTYNKKYTRLILLAGIISAFIIFLSFDASVTQTQVQDKVDITKLRYY